MTMGEIIRELRVNANMTQEELGEKLGVQKSAIRKYEKGEVENIKRSTIKKLSEIFDKSPSFIMGFEEPKSNVTPNFSEHIIETYGNGSLQLLEYYSKLNDDGKAQAMDQLELLAGSAKYTGFKNEQEKMA